MILAAFNLARYVAWLLGENPPVIPGRTQARFTYYGGEEQ